MTHLIVILVVAALAPFVFRATDYLAVFLYVALLAGLAFAVPKIVRHTAEAQRALATPKEARPEGIPNTQNQPARQQTSPRQPGQLSADSNAAKLECEQREHQPCELLGGIWMAPRQYQAR